MSTSFNFANKENASHLSRAAPKTPLNSKSIIFKNNNHHNNPKKIPVLSDGLKTPNNNVDSRNQKRIPLGGKDKNAQFNHNSLKISAGSLNDHQKGGLTSSAAKRRIRRLRNTPLSNRPPSKKLNVLRDEPVEVEAHNAEPLVIEDDEIEYVPEKEPALPFEPLNYDPFTQEELDIFKNGTNPRTFDCRDDIVPMSEAEVNEEFPINFESESESETNSITSPAKSLPHFMKPTFVSSARSKQNKKVEVYDEGLSIAELQRIIDEDG